MDTTGDVSAVRAEFDGWDLWESQPTGHLYASTVMPDGQGTTVDDCLAGRLRTKMLAVEAAKSRARESVTDHA